MLMGMHLRMMMNDDEYFLLLLHIHLVRMWVGFRKSVEFRVWDCGFRA